MGMDVWLREDVMRILACTHQTMKATLDAAGPQPATGAAAYERGFTDALRAVGLGFGLAQVGVYEAGASGARYEERDEADRRCCAIVATSANGGGGRWKSRDRDLDSEAWESV